MNLNLFLTAMRVRFGVFAMVLGVTVLAATLLSMALPKSYRATVSLLVDTKDEQSLSTMVMIPQREMRIAYIQTQVDILTNEKVARKVVQDLHLADDPVIRASFEKKGGSIKDWVRETLLPFAKERPDHPESIEDALVESLIQNLKVETSQSSIIHVTFTWSDPRFAARVANGFAQAYLDTTLELRVEPTRRAVAWFDEQAKRLRTNLEEAQAKLTDYQRQQGIIATDERFDVERTRLAELSSQLVKAQDQTFDLQSRAEQARRVLGEGASPDRLAEVNSSPHIQRLNSELLQGEARLQELATQYDVNYPLYKRQLSENRSRRQKLDGEMRKIVAGIEGSKRQSLQREAELRGALKDQQSRLLELTENRNELTVLKRNLESAQKTYDTVMERFAISQVESRASQANVAILSSAVAARKPYRPKVGLNIALALVVGTMLGVGIVILLEMSDRRIRSLVDLHHGGAEVPLLGVLNAWEPPKRLMLTAPHSVIPPGAN